MRRLGKAGKRVLAFALTLAMIFTSLNLSQIPVNAGVTNEFEPTVTTHGATYDAAKKEVTFFVNTDDAHYEAIQTMWYKEYESYEEAAKNHVSKGGNFIVGVGASALTETNGRKELTVKVADSTKAVLYYINGEAGHARTDYEHILLIDDAEGVAETTEGETTGGETQTGITSLEVYNSDNGPEIANKDGNLFSFCLPKVNGAAIEKDTLDEVKKGYIIQIKKGDAWKNIEDSDSGITHNDKADKENTWKYDYWSWEGGGAYAIAFNFTESKQIRFQSVANAGVHLDYTLTYTEPPVAVTSLALAETEKDITTTGSYLFAFDSIIVNDSDEVKGSELQNNNMLKWFIDPKADGHFYELGAEGSGLAWSTNWGWDSAGGNGGFWFNPIKNTVVLRVELASDSSIYAEIKLIINNTVTEKGSEYDFTKDNSAYDYADPGTTKEGYELVWKDEFDGNYGTANVDATTGLNLDNWSYQLGDGSEVGNPGWGNSEQQSYTSQKKNIAVNEDLNGDGKGDGLLRLTASYEKDGYKNGSEAEKNYTSGRIRTTSRTNEALFTTTYGYIEGRMSLPGTQGAWPAFWMLPQSTEIYGSWPVSGEIDIMETCGAFSDLESNVACGTLHWGVPAHVYKGSGYVELQSDYSYFHTYAIDWEPGKITWYYDGVAVNTLQNWESMISGTTDSLSYDAPFDQPFYILLNLAVDSGQFGGAVNRATFQDDINMYVDYVRAYQKTEGYAESVNRTASDGVKDDWDEYEGINQIADIKADNLDANGFGSDASADSSKWYLSCNANSTGGAADVTPYTDADGKTWAKVDITEAGSQDYSVQMIGHYDAKQGYLYKVSFDAYADGDMVGKTVNTDSKEWAGWSTNGIQSYELTNTPQNVAFTFEQKSDFEKCRIEFNLGAKSTGNVYISNVKVEIVDPAEINSESGRKPLSNGDVIYNGTFDQGIAHIGGWSAAEGTTLKVPRYTTEQIAADDVKVVDTASTVNSYEALTNGGVKYYERRAQISAESGAPVIYQPGIALKADAYTLNFDMYSAAATTVQAAIYSVDSEGKLGTKLLESPVVNYTDAKTIKNYTWTFTTPRALDNAALALTFGDGAVVQIDNVTMLGKGQAEVLDKTPVNSETQWGANGADGGSVTDEGITDGVHKFTGVTSGPNWYSPQITSAQFKTGAGAKYKMSAKLKLEGTSNNKVSYIVQNQGSWEVIHDLTEIDLTKLGEPDEDGFYTYTETITCPGNAYSNVALNFGLGSSAANDATFSFKDVSLTLDTTGGSGSGNTGESMGETQTGIAIKYVLGAEDAVNADANPFYYTQGEGTITLAAPTREGYLFAGWTLEEDSTDYITEVSTDTASITVYAHWIVRVDAAAPVISRQPADVDCAVGAAKELTVTAAVTDNGTLSYQWYKNTTKRIKNAVAIENATAAAYVPDTSAAGTTYYFCVVTNTNADVNGTKTAATTSDIVTVNVNDQVDAAAPAITTQPAGTTYTAGDAAKALTVAASVADGGKLSYQWYKNSTNTVVGATAIAGATKAEYTPATTTAGTTYYFCVVTNTNDAATGVKTASTNSALAAIVVNAKAITTVTYTVTFDSNGGTAVAAQTVAEGKTATKPADPTRKGYRFAGWYVGNTAYNFATPVKANTTVTAKWTEIKVSKIKITGISKQIAAGKKVKLKATVTPSTAKNRAVSWKTSNKKYATVNAKGVVTVKKAGIGKTVKITATAKDGSNKKATFKIKIMKNAVKKITLKAKTTKVKAGKKVTIKATVSPSKSLNKKLTWKTSNKKYATVNAKGVVTTKKAGKGKTVTITATATDGSGKKKSIKIKITK